MCMYMCMHMLHLSRDHFVKTLPTFIAPTPPVSELARRSSTGTRTDHVVPMAALRRFLAMRADTGADTTLTSLPDDALQLVITACSNTARPFTAYGVPHFMAVKGLACSKALRQQLHRLQPLVGVWSLAVMHELMAHGPWRVTLASGSSRGSVKIRKHCAGQDTAHLIPDLVNSRLRDEDWLCVPCAELEKKHKVQCSRCSFAFEVTREAAERQRNEMPIEKQYKITVGVSSRV